VNTSWPRVRLDQIFVIARGGSPRPIENFLTQDPSGVNWIMIADAPEGSKYITATKKRINADGVSRSRIVNPGDFVLTNSMSFGRPYILKISGCIHDGWLVLSPKSAEISRDFFYHLLGSDLLYAEFERRAAGATVKNLNIDLVKGVEVTFPPLSEQRRIAEVLDRAEALRAKRRAALAELDCLTQSIFLDMFGDPVRNPKGWPNSTLGGALTFQQYGPRFFNESYSADGVRIVRITDLDECGTLDFDAMPKMKVTNEDRDKYTLRPGDLVFARTGATVGKVAMIGPKDPPCIAGAYFITLRFTDSVIPLYVRTVLTTPSVRAIVASRSRQAAQQNFSGPGLRQLPLPVPPISQQREFVRRCDMVDQLKVSQRASLAELKALFASLQHRAFRGEL
jgi:type I restriction enzyme S subunit